MSGLAPGWATATLDELAAPEPRPITDGPFGSNLKTAHYTASGPRVIRLQNIGDGRFIDDEAHISDSHFERLRAHSVEPGDLLIAGLGERLPRACIAPDSIGLAIVKADCFRVRLHRDISPGFICAALNSPQMRTAASHEISGLGRPRLNLGKVRGLIIPIPPPPEQRRIVDAIEEQFSRIDAALVSLLSARRKTGQLANQATFSLVSGVGRFSRLGDIAEIGLGRQRSPANHSGPNMVPYLRAANVTWDGLDLADVKLMNFSPREVGVFGLKPGDVLLAEASGSASEVGKPAIWDGSIPACCFQNTLLRVRSDQLLPEYLYFVMYALARSGQFARASKGVGMYHLSKSGLAEVMINVPALPVQREIVSVIRNQREQYRALSGAIEKELHRAKRLRSSILLKAISGRLVPQDPHDEPAVIALKRITAERDGAPVRRTRRPRTASGET